MSDHPSPHHPTQWLSQIGPRLAAQMRFLIEADRLKTVIRGSRIADGSRRENVAEHSWHLALFAMLLCEWAAEPVDACRVIQMLIVHDLVEIECGDTPLFDAAQSQTQAEREAMAAEKLFGILPSDQAERLRSLWTEFEAAATPDARFAKSIDRFQPILLNHLVRGGTWSDFDVDERRERAVANRIADGSPALWDMTEKILVEAVREGWLRAAPDVVAPPE